MALKKKTRKKTKVTEDLKLDTFKKVEGEVIHHDDEPSVPAELADLDLPEINFESDRALTPATDPVTRYMSEIGRYPLLTREQEREVAIQYRETGNAKAAERLVTANLRFVVKVAAEYTRFGVRLIDLVQEGNVGLMHAVKEFNPYKGTRLITYAVWWIRGYIQEYLMRQYSMGANRHDRDPA